MCLHYFNNVISCGRCVNVERFPCPSQSNIDPIVSCVVLSCPRPPQFVGRLAGSCRSKSYHHMACSPPTCGSDSVHSEPTSRRAVRSRHPVGGPGMTAAEACGGRRGHTTRYIIVNEHAPRKKLLHSAMRIPRHYLIAEPPEILELYPHSAEYVAPPHTKQRSHRPNVSHLTQEWEDQEEEERLKRKRRTQEHRLLADRHAHFYNGDHIKNHGSRHSNPRRYGKAKQEDGEGETDHLASRFHSSMNEEEEEEEDGLQLYLLHQSPVRTKHLKKTKVRAKAEPPQTESDSASLGSSSDQQNSSTDQYIQVIHNRSEFPPPKLAQKRSKTILKQNATESHDLVCSNV